MDPRRLVIAHATTLGRRARSTYALAVLELDAATGRERGARIVRPPMTLAPAGALRELVAAGEDRRAALHEAWLLNDVPSWRRSLVDPDRGAAAAEPLADLRAAVAATAAAARRDLPAADVLGGCLRPLAAMDDEAVFGYLEAHPDLGELAVWGRVLAVVPRAELRAARSDLLVGRTTRALDALTAHARTAAADVVPRG